MFRTLGNAVARHWRLLLAGWLGTALALWVCAPPWAQVVREGEFRFMPDDVPSRQGERLFAEAFAGNFLGSNAVVVLRRLTGEAGLLDKDRDFVEQHLRPGIEALLAEDDAEAGGADRSAQGRVRTFSDRSIGHLLESDDRRGSLVLVELTGDFAAERNRRILERIEALIGDDGELRRAGLIPHGLDVAVSGSATVGRDMSRAAQDSAFLTELTAVLLIAALLLGAYRMPVLALVPLAAAFVVVRGVLAAMALLAGVEWLDLFAGLDVYLIVVLYATCAGWGTLLVARYREELDGGASRDEAVAASIDGTGRALATCAAAAAAGVGVMAFSAFGKFQQAGVALGLGVPAALAAVLTLTPALLLLAGRWAFWPHLRTERLPVAGGWVSPVSPIARLLERNWSRLAWKRIGHALVANPSRMLLLALAVLVPPAILGAAFFRNVSYSMLSELPHDEPSLVGARAIQEHFPAGLTGPVVVLLENRRVNFSGSEGSELVADLTRRLLEHRNDLGIADVRSIADPLGTSVAARAAEARQEDYLSTLRFRDQVSYRVGRRKRVLDHYVGSRNGMENHVTRIDVVFRANPFARDGVDQFDRLQERIEATLPTALRPGSRLHFIGPTAGIRDLKSVTERDQVCIALLGLAAVVLVLTLALRRPALAGGLVLAEVAAFLAALGAAFCVLWVLSPVSFAGPEGKVPVLLFAVLIGCGLTGPLYLLARLDEEQPRHGLPRGLTVALSKSGSAVSHAGLVMTSAFLSLLAASLVGMNQLGFALALGVLLNAFLVRPFLLPAGMLLMHERERRPGWSGEVHSERDRLPAPTPPELTAPSATSPLNVRRDGEAC